MCRIAGIIDRTNGQLALDIQSMRDAMQHGGPDDSGIYIDEERGLAFGHRRLSIIDLSAAGHQPMQREDVVVSFNGEIYNFRELRSILQAQGHGFSTQTDTEVIIRAYQQWGTGCFDKFRGMFALAIYDLRKRQLVLARDHAGIKPLYYYAHGEKIYFASEIRAFRALGRWPEREDWRIFFLSFGFLPEPVTTLSGVRPLEKGSFMVFDLSDSGRQQRTFYKEVYSNEITDLGAAKARLQQTLRTSLERHLISDASIGLFLSGGIDSSLLTLLAQPVVPQSLHTLSLVFEDQQFSEQIFQDIIIERTGAKHQSFLIGKADFEESFDDILLSMDQPSTDGINSYFICKYARRAGLKAVLSGLGADELLGGYPSFRRARHYPHLKKMPAMMFALMGYADNDRYRKFSFLQRKDPVGEYLFYRGYFVPAEISRLLGCSTGQVREALSGIRANAAVADLPHGNRASFLESNYYMQGQLLKDTDMMSMWHSVEVRVPFLDRDFMEGVHSISPELKFGHAQGKYLLIEAFKDLLPREIWDRKKQGFVLPFSKWMKGQHLMGQGKLPVGQKALHRRFNAGKLAWSRYWASLLAQPEQRPEAAPEEDSALFFEPKEPGRNGTVPSVLFLNLTTFIQAGGIERFNRCLLKAMQELEAEGRITSMSYSAYDQFPDEQYYPYEHYKGFGGKRTLFIVQAVAAARNHDQVILGHINLAPVGYMIKQLFPQKKVIVITHGIEVWQPLEGVKLKLLQAADEILSVSHFTRDKLAALHHIPAARIRVFPNTIDPFFPMPTRLEKNLGLREKYGMAAADPVLFTLSRLSSSEKYKGYDLVIRSLPRLKQQYPRIRYIIAGKYDEAEKTKLDLLIEELGLQENVIITGFLSEKLLIDYYQAADVFIMPSQKEGFGIVFLEAMVCGLPVIAGNMDGSVDALRNGELGILVDPTDVVSITEGVSLALERSRSWTTADARIIQQKALDYFGFEKYRNRLRQILAPAVVKKETSFVR